MSFKKIYFFFSFCICANLLFAQNEIVVAKDDSGNFKSIQEAINSLPIESKGQRTVKIKKGIYKQPKDADNWVVWGLIMRTVGNYTSAKHKRYRRHSSPANA